MSREARRYSRKDKVQGLAIDKPTEKHKWVEDRVERSKITVVAKTQNQKLMIQSVERNTVTIASGSAGTGKSLVACYLAANALLGGEVQKIVITRPYVALANRTTGFKPSTDLEKLRGFLLPMLGYLGDVLGKGMVEMQIGQADGKVELAPLESLRGRSFDNAMIICDESQGLLPAEVQALVTRLGENSRIIFCGDAMQRDVREDQCGLLYLERIIQKYNIQNCGIIKFTKDDVVRSGICKEFVIAFDREITGE